ncbi:MAG: glycosyltransferase [Burkholderiales bacterium]|nr:glycosyltransferase [Burkholderiales bacterium]
MVGFAFHDPGAAAFFGGGLARLGQARWIVAAHGLGSCQYRLKILFLHQNFPGQFKHLAPALAQRGHEVHALLMAQRPGYEWLGVHVHTYFPKRGSAPNIHPWLVDMEAKTIRAEAVLRWALSAKEQGFVPQAVIAHPSWGESLFIKHVWPDTRLGLFYEMFYQAHGQDVHFDPEFSKPELSVDSRLLMKNAVSLIQDGFADAAISPTHWQAATYAPHMREKITVVHDGIDTQQIRPDPQARLVLADGRSWTAQDEVVTFVSRNLEPYRGYHVFMRALPELLRLRPHAQVLLVGADGVSYGAKPPGPDSWKQVFINEVKGQISQADWQRVHFLGRLSYPLFLTMLQISRVHVYLTYPFVLSWSLIEAMSSGCAILASDTAPVREAIIDGQTGRLLPFFEPEAWAQGIHTLLDQPEERARMGALARQHAVAHYDLQTVCLPRQLAWVEALS